MPRDYRLYLDDIVEAIKRIRTIREAWTIKLSPLT